MDFHHLVFALILWRFALGLLMGKFRQVLTELSAWDMPIYLFPDGNFSKCHGNLTNLVHALILRRSGSGLLMGKFHHFLTELSARNMIMAGYYHFTFLFHEEVRNYWYVTMRNFVLPWEMHLTWGENQLSIWSFPIFRSFQIWELSLLFKSSAPMRREVNMSVISLPFI